jgi:hypothetical protein
MIRYAVLMSRLRPAVIVVLAVLLAAQLTLHNHSLIPEAGGVPALACGVCAFGADPGALDTPLFAAALVLLGLASVRADKPALAARRAAMTGRAPPVAG